MREKNRNAGQCTPVTIPGQGNHVKHQQQSYEKNNSKTHLDHD